MKFHVKAVASGICPEAMDRKEIPVSVLPPVRTFQYAWAYTAALAVLLAGMLIGRIKKKRRGR